MRRRGASRSLARGPSARRRSPRSRDPSDRGHSTGGSRRRRSKPTARARRCTRAEARTPHSPPPRFIRPGGGASTWPRTGRPRRSARGGGGGGGGGGGAGLARTGSVPGSAARLASSSSTSPGGSASGLSGARDSGARAYAAADRVLSRPPGAAVLVAPPSLGAPLAPPEALLGAETHSCASCPLWACPVGVRAAALVIWLARPGAPTRVLLTSPGGAGEHAAPTAFDALAGASLDALAPLAVDVAIPRVAPGTAMAFPMIGVDGDRLQSEVSSESARRRRRRGRRGGGVRPVVVPVAVRRREDARGDARGGRRDARGGRVGGGGGGGGQRRTRGGFFRARTYEGARRVFGVSLRSPPAGRVHGARARRGSRAAERRARGRGGRTVPVPGGRGGHLGGGEPRREPGGRRRETTAGGGQPAAGARENLRRRRTLRRRRDERENRRRPRKRKRRI